MENINIILFVCNWGPHTAFQTLQDIRADIPPEIKMVRIPCTGRISKSLLFKSFEKGADGVMLVGCKSGACRYGSGTTTAIENIRDTRELLELVGIGKERLRLATFLPDESEALLQLLTEFTNKIQELGSSTVVPSKGQAPEFISRELLAETVSLHDVFTCQDCGKCTSACPLALIGKPFSPRAVANSVIAGDISSSVKDDIWSCLTCGLCYERCPSAVNFSEFIQDIRYLLKKSELTGHETHGGFFHSLMRTMTTPELKTDRWNWLPDDVKIDKKSKTLFFGGCAPYFDTFFRKFMDVNTCNILSDSIRLLNFFDIQPALLENERCCGHDLLWSGDKENFLKLARLNAEAINNLGIEEVITACPECYRSLGHDYAKHGVDIQFNVTHLYDFLEREIGKGAVDLKKMDRDITYQDSCRLSRFENKSDLPRKLLSRLKPDGFQEMQETASAALCCGNSAWIGCDAYSKALQVKRLMQAKATGSELLVTSCPKCQIHLKCAMEDPFRGDDLKIETMDLASIVARSIYWE